MRGLTIGEAAARLAGEFPGLRPETLRAMERHGLLAPRRTPSGYRRYTELDLETVRRILLEASAAYAEPMPTPAPVAPPAAVPAPRPTQPVAAARAEISGASGANHPLPPDSPAGPAPAAEAPATRRRSPRWPEPEYFAPELGEVALGPEGLARAAGLEAHRVAELAGFGLISGAQPATGADLLVARAAADLLEHGIEPRHLRPVVVAAGRAAALIRAAGGGSARSGTAQAAAALVRLEAALLRAALLDD
ncbi:MerR family transcriptional regulator [Actinospica robiniae]|uniref:MerR family transcriptional regulator n=1 Tax=Actinospica robiniae TaxID=304901 RepID=UPI000554293A|nr:MerR family DNA-binding transcriptional regulator [Actinospica robiniae]